MWQQSGCQTFATLTLALCYLAVVIVILLHCTALQETRKNIIGLQQPFKESIDENISDFVLFKENSEK